MLARTADDARTRSHFLEGVSGKLAENERLPPKQHYGGAPQIPIGGLLTLLGGGKLSLPMIFGILGILAVCACLCIFVLGPSGPGDGSVLPAATQPGAASQPTSLPGPTRPPRPFTPPAVSSGGGQTWLVMLYQDADDKVLEQDIYLDLNEAEHAGRRHADLSR